jgi:predicted MFS family arabinose efflux permease
MTRQGSAATDDAGPRLSGTRIIWSDAMLRGSLLVTALAIACAVVDNVAAPFRFVDELGTDGRGYGAYLALWGVGGLVGSQLPRVLRGRGFAVALAAGNAVTGVGIAGIGLAPSLTFALVASTVGGVGNGLANVSESALVASRVRPDQRGRAFASVAAVIQAATGLGTIAGAPLVATLGAGVTMSYAGGLAAVVAALSIGWLVIRASREEPSMQPSLDVRPLIPQ